MDLDKIKQAALRELERIRDLAGFELAKVKHIGRSSELSDFLRTLKDRTADERRDLGAMANQLKADLEAEFDKRKMQLDDLSGRVRERLDITRPAPALPRGHIHPLTQAQEDIGRIFATLGFEILEGPEVETEWYNFDALNIPADHPARDMQDTFWIKSTHNPQPTTHNPSSVVGGKSSVRHLLRTQTSPMQIRYMETHQPPLRIIVPGRVYRHEATDATHEFQFHQLEGLMVDRQSSSSPVSMANLKGIVEYFFKQFFRDDVEVRFVQRYFPFTEPSVEIEIKGKKGRLKDKWLEVAGAGMVHQSVFKDVGYASNEFQGFAFGMAIERLAMLKYKIDDIRLFQGGDLRFLKQF